MGGFWLGGREGGTEEGSKGMGGGEKGEGGGRKGEGFCLRADEHAWLFAFGGVRWKRDEQWRENVLLGSSAFT